MKSLGKAYNEKQSQLLFTTSRLMKVITSKIEPQDLQACSRLELTNFIRIYFNFTYYLCASPFRLIKDENNRYVPKTWKPQQIACAVMHILCLFRMIADVRGVFPEKESTLSRNPTPYFRIVLLLCSLFYKLVTMKRFWMNQSDYSAVLNCIVREALLPHWNMKISTTCISYLLCGFNVFQVVSCQISGMGFVAPIWMWSPSWWLRRLIAFARHVFCFENRLRDGVAPEWSDVTIWDGVLVVPMFLAVMQRHVLGFFCDLCILSSALTLWTSANSFAKDINDVITDHADDQNQQIIPVKPKQHRRDQQWPILYAHFQAIRNLSMAINTALGSQVTWFMAEALMYYSVNLNSVLLTKDNFKRIYLITFYIATFCILYITADVCFQMEHIELWLVKRDNSKAVPPDEANLVLHEMLEKNIGIRGSNIFTMTYPLVATFLSLIVTFFIICVQQSEVTD